MVENTGFQLELQEKGYVSGLFMKNDPYGMNWVIEDSYLRQTGYENGGRLFGQFDLRADGKEIRSSGFTPVIEERGQQVTVSYDLGTAAVSLEYDLGRSGDKIYWTIRLENRTDHDLEIQDFGIWAAFAYVMFRDKNVLRNIHNSAAVFPSVSTDYTKLNMVRRDNQGRNLGLYQVSGRTISVGTYCDYTNLFFENASPSLDGMLFHKLILAGGYPEGFENRDWIYEKSGFLLPEGKTKVWEYVMCVNDGQEDFLDHGQMLGHPKIRYTPLNIVGEMVRLTAELPEGKEVSLVKICRMEDGVVKERAVQPEKARGEYRIAFRPERPGEHKVVFVLADGTEDFAVLNVMDRLDRVIEERAAFICDELYNGPEGSTPYAFEPVSNQGESLGKLNLVLKKNLLGTLNVEQVRKVEESAVRYVRPKWFRDGDFTKPVRLYGDFYRCMDFEYIGHLFYLLSEFDGEVLALHSPETYLRWAADVFNLRVNPQLHEDDRGREEAQMLGVYFLYFNDLLRKLKDHGLSDQYETIREIWETAMERVDAESLTYRAAVTEHFYDNAGFGPTAGALGESGRLEGAQRYGQLLLANIGCSNDFRGQNPDRWWEALTYMIHSLWGGLTAAAAFRVFEALKKTEYLEASYRATAGILYCYDTHATAATPLGKGMAASTYAVAGPHINRPDLSRDRFGQSTFYRDGGIFARLFDDDSQTPDWDMGEELVAYLDGFGRKTYIIEEEGSVRVINGSFEEREDTYQITSFAPYSEEFYLISEKGMALLKKEKGLRNITLAKKG